MRSLHRIAAIALLALALSVALPPGVAGQGAPDRKIAQIQAAIKKASDDGDPRAEFKGITDLATAYYGAGRFDDALREFERALAFAKECQHPPDEGRALVNLGFYYLDHGNDRERAIEYYNLGVEAARSGGDEKGEAFALESLAGVYEATDRKKADALQKQANEAMRAYEAASQEWNALKKRGGDRTDYNAFIAKHPKSYFAEFARAARPSALVILTSPDYKKLFKAAVDRLSADPSLTLVVDGHASAVDEPGFDTMLVSGAVELLTGAGVDQRRIITRRFGTKCPAADGRTFRVEFRFVAKGEPVDRNPAACP